MPELIMLFRITGGPHSWNAWRRYGGTNRGLMNLTQWGLIFKFVGSFFLSLHIIGRGRVEKLENWLITLPDAPYNFIENIVIKFVQFQINKTDWEQGGWLEIYQITKHNMELEKWRVSFNSGTKDFQQFRQRFPGLYYLIRLIIVSFLIFLPLIFIVKILIGLPLRLILIFFFIKDRLKVESSFGISGVILLVMGFLLQFMGSFYNR
jgi:hypothetical protein